VTGNLSKKNAKWLGEKEIVHNLKGDLSMRVPTETAKRRAI